jgi:hypothetical protein
MVIQDICRGQRKNQEINTTREARSKGSDIEEGNALNKDAQIGKKDNALMQEEKGREDTKMKETSLAATPQETTLPKHPIIHTGGS